MGTPMTGRAAMESACSSKSMVLQVNRAIALSQADLGSPSFTRLLPDSTQRPEHWSSVTGLVSLPYHHADGGAVTTPPVFELGPPITEAHAIVEEDAAWRLFLAGNVGASLGIEKVETPYDGLAHAPVLDARKRRSLYRRRGCRWQVEPAIRWSSLLAPSTST